MCILEVMVQFKNVTKIYKNSIVGVNNVSFVIDPGEFVFLIGPSGSGKTTIIKMLIRDELPTTGKIFFDDKDITKLPRRKVYRLRREIGVIFQDYKLVPEKTVYENVAFAMEAAGKSNKEIKEAVPYVLDIVGLEHRMDAFPRELSGGEQQRVAIARAIANNPKILIADEPTGNLDPASAWDIVQVLTKINSWGTTVIMSTHGTEIVNSLNKRVIQMHKGEIIRDDSEGQYEMTSAYEKGTLDATEVDTQKKPDFFEEKHKKLKIEISKKIKEAQEEVESDEEKSKSDTSDNTSGENDESNDSDKKPIELKITLGRKGVKIPVKAQSEETNSVDSQEKESNEAKKKNKKITKKSSKDKKVSVKQADLSEKDISDLKISKKLKKLLMNNGYKNVSDLNQIDLNDLAQIEGISKKDIDELNKLLQ
ncbi:MAG: hypothetical protein KatS3mg085_729 [Candidatus Dojkabacteria bacterium]|nr:MAG: hypothetical protein KatS3mg085_729 [Candidatus Dojkabacteria bacterium]GIW58750.1 MAG: hypothetical protein KatS3mg086_035 [Candidatus Dojkabacteria bacterium]